MNDRLFIGLDGGGTKTHTVCMSADGTVRGEILTGSTNVNSVGREDAFKNLKEGIEGAILNANATKLNVVSVCLGMASVDSEDDKADRLKWVIDIFGEQPLKIQLQNDGVIALASGTKKLHGIVVISGTGAIVMAVREGQSYRASGWGPLLGDEGSGFAIGQCLLRAVCFAEDGGPQTILTKLVLNELKLDCTRKLIDWAYRDLSWARFAALSPLVFLAASQGDKVAEQILESNANHLLENIKLVVKSAGFSGRTPLVFAGGNLTHNDGNGIYTQILKRMIKQQLPDLDFIFPSLAAPVAAGWLAIDDYKLQSSL